MKSPIHEAAEVEPENFEYVLTKDVNDKEEWAGNNCSARGEQPYYTHLVGGTKLKKSERRVTGRDKPFEPN